jgi:ATP-dependent DNA helicase DinG
MPETPTPTAAHAAAVDDARRDAIRADYERLRAGLPGFRARASQRHMIAAVARALAGGGVAAIEAPTGTGKSMAYLVAGLPLARAAGKRLLVSTATVALQEQLVRHDLPQYLGAVGASASVVLAKGRQRYACTRNLHQLAGADEGAQAGLGLGGDAESTGAWPRRPRAGELVTVEELLRTLSTGDWDGDLDAAPEPVDESLRELLTTTAGGCSNRRCAFIARCPFLTARNRLGKADIVVANHDLVLADLMLEGEGGEGTGGVLLPGPADALYVFDEAHHLAAKAIGRGAAQVHLASAAQRLPRLRLRVRAAYAMAAKEAIGRLLAEDAEAMLSELEAGLEAFEAMLRMAWSPAPDDREPRWRASLGRLPEDWRADALALAVLCERAERWLPALQRAVLEAADAPPAAQEDLARELGVARERLERQGQLWRRWAEVEDADDPPVARWIDLARDQGLVCHASPVSAAPLLQRVLWGQAAGVVLTSATLAPGGDFAALDDQLGLPPDAERLRLPSPFDLAAQARLELPPMQAEPTANDAHAAEIAAWLDQGLDWDAGNLVLFTSRRKMNDVLARMPAARRPRCRGQDSAAKAALLAAHREAIARGEGSTLFGLASFGEGLDLPGALCTTVVVTQLPFAVPTDPVGATWAEWLEAHGRNPFLEVSVPEATRTLVQYCGRLIRGEDDRGRIVILDRRITAKRYGAWMLAALPPFGRG